jgi:hypothetical protein
VKAATFQNRPRPLAAIGDEIRQVEQDIRGLLKEVMG